MRWCKIEAMVYSMFSRERERGRHVYKARDLQLSTRALSGRAGKGDQVETRCNKGGRKSKKSECME